MHLLMYMSKTSIPVLHLEPVGLHPVNCKGSSITFVLEPSFFNWTWNFRLRMFSKHLFGDRHAGSACTSSQHKEGSLCPSICTCLEQNSCTSEYWHQTLDFLAPYNVQVNICSLVKSASLNSQERPNLAKCSWNEMFFFTNWNAGNCLFLAKLLTVSHPVIACMPRSALQTSPTNTLPMEAISTYFILVSEQHFWNKGIENLWLARHKKLTAAMTAQEKSYWDTWARCSIMRGYLLFLVRTSSNTSSTILRMILKHGSSHVINVTVLRSLNLVLHKLFSILHSDAMNLMRLALFTELALKLSHYWTTWPGNRVL